jgi:hypothetical protein
VRTCKHCKTKVPKDKVLIVNVQSFCDWDCVHAFTQSDQGRAAAERMQRKEQKQERKELRERKQALKKIPQLKVEAQTAFNKYIRLRDWNKPCVSCGKPPNNSGNQRDASHYLARGRTNGGEYRRFDPLNVHASCKVCNQYREGNLIGYRKELVLRIGEARVTEIEETNRVKKWNHVELRRIKAIYAKKYRLYKRLFR